MNILIDKSEKTIISIETFKSHLRILHDLENEYIYDVINMATDLFEKSIETPILKKKFKYIYNKSVNSLNNRIILPLCNVSEILSVKSCVSDKQLSFLSKQNGSQTEVILESLTDPIEIIYVAGFVDDPSEVSGDIKYAIIKIAKNIYDGENEDVLSSTDIQNVIQNNRKLTIN